MRFLEAAKAIVTSCLPVKSFAHRATRFVHSLNSTERVLALESGRSPAAPR